MHQNTIMRTTTAHTNIAASSNCSNARRVYINIAAIIDDARKVHSKWQPAAMVVMLGEHIPTK